MLRACREVLPEHYLIDEDRFDTGLSRGSWLFYVPKRNLLYRMNAAAARAMAEALETGEAPRGTPLEHLWEEACAPLPSDLVDPVSREENEAPERFQPCLVSLFLTNRCQLRCLYCYARAGRVPDRTMPLDMAQAAVDGVVKHALELGRERFSVAFHGGGEASMAWDLLQQITAYAQARARETGLSVTFSLGTNGVLSPVQCEWLAANLHSATLSLDGPPEVQDRQRPTAGGGPSSSAVETTLARFHELGLKVSIRATITRASAPHQEAFVRYLSTLPGVNHAQFQPMWPSGQGKLEAGMVPEPDVFVRHFLAAKSLGVSLGVRLSMSGTGDAGYLWDQGYCGVVGRNFSVTPSGEVSACYEVVDGDCEGSEAFLFGRYDPALRTFVFDEQKLSRLRAMRGLARKVCQDCFCLPTCAGGCPVKVAPRGEYAEAPVTPECDIIRALTLHNMQLSLEGQGAFFQKGGTHDPQ